MMFKFVILCLYVCLAYGNYLKEGATCLVDDNTDGLCVNEKRCFSALDKQSELLEPCLDAPKGKKIVCCPDCDLVDDTSKAVISPTGGTFWKTGNKARDSCLQYLKVLPYKCKETYVGGVKREVDEERRCHTTHDWAIGSISIDEQNNKTNRTEYPHQALLGYGDTLGTAEWLAGGSIISDRYILTAAHVGVRQDEGELNFVALGVLNISNPSTWQVHRVKRFIPHPSYFKLSTYRDIALIETEKQITFTENVLPACLPVEKMNVTEAVATTWWDLTQEGRVFADNIQTIKNIEPFPNEVCNSTYSNNVLRLHNGFNKKIQLCFASKKNPSDSCRGLSGEPLLVNKQFSSCLYTVIGVTSFGSLGCGPTEEVLPEVYTKVSYFVPWIESVVWPKGIKYK